MVDELATPAPVLHQLPGTYQDGDFTARLVSVIDSVLAPVFTTLDNLAAHLDPGTAPPDLLAYVGGWVQAAPGAEDELAEQRQRVAEAVAEHRMRGTAEGLRRSVAALSCCPVDVSESGGSAWSTTPGQPLPGSAPASVTVTVRPPSGPPLDVAAIRAVLADGVPAHVECQVEVIGP